MRLALIILVVGMICIAGVSYVGINSKEEVEHNLTIKNPKTGELWNSIEEYKYRDINLTQVEK